MSKCLKCGKELSDLDIATHLKMINRGATEYMCIDCLADYYKVSRKAIEERIEFYRKSGCVLFK